MIGTISTTANVLNVQPTAAGQMLAQESPKAAAQVQAELAAAQVLYPAYQAVAATVAAPPAPPAPTGPQGQQQNTPPPGGQSLNTAQQTGPVVNATATVAADTGAVTATKIVVDPTPTVTPPTSDPAQSAGPHAHAPSRAPGPAARDHRDYAAASARAGSGSARNTRFGCEPDGHRPDRHQCLGQRGMGRPRRRAVNLLPEGLRAWDGVSRHQQFHPDLFAQRRRPERGGAAAQSHAAGTRSQSRSRADLRRPSTSRSMALPTRRA